MAKIATKADLARWHAFSGYGVGAGLEDAGYGFSTQGCEDRLWELFERPTNSQTGVSRRGNVRLHTVQGSASREPA